MHKRAEESGRWSAVQNKPIVKWGVQTKERPRHLHSRIESFKSKSFCFQQTTKFNVLIQNCCRHLQTKYSELQTQTISALTAWV